MNSAVQFVRHRLHIDGVAMTDLTGEVRRISEPRIANKMSEAMDAMVQDILKPYTKMRTVPIGTTSKILHRYSTTNSTMDEVDCSTS